MKSYTHFTLSERNCLQQFLSEGKGVREIGRLMGRSASSISREINRNCKDKKKYNAWWATSLYIYRRKKCVRKHVIRPDTKLYIYILECFKRFWSPEIIAHKCKQQGFRLCCASIYRALKETGFKVCQGKLLCDGTEKSILVIARNAIQFTRFTLFTTDRKL